MSKITIQRDSEGYAEGVRVQAMDEDFLIALTDRYNGEEVTFKEAVKKNYLPDSPMALVFSMLYLEINAAIKDAGGTPMKGWYWTKTPANIVLGEDESGYLILEGRHGCLNRNYDFFLCEAKVREFTDLRKKDEE